MMSFILYSFFFISNVLFTFFFKFILGIPIILGILYLTMLTFWLSTIYYFIMSFYHLRLYLNRNNEEEHNRIKGNSIYVLFKEKISIFVFVLSFTATIGYWGLLLGGSTLMYFTATPGGLFFSIYAHGITAVYATVDLIYNHRRYLEESWRKNVLILLAINVTYGVVLTFIAKKFEVYIYPFLKLEHSAIFGIYLIMIMVTFNMYQIYHFYMRKVNRDYRKKNDESCDYKDQLLDNKSRVK